LKFKKTPATEKVTEAASRGALGTLQGQALVARQPICGASQRTFAYELLFRRDKVSGAIIDDPAKATAQVIVNSFMEIGLDRMVGQSAAFINVSADFIMGDHCLSLPRDRVVLEILEDTVPTPELLARLRELTAQGYQFALDDYTFDERMTPILPFCLFVKVDVRQIAREEMIKKIADVRRLGVSLLAEKVETVEEFEFYRDAGFQYFQGYFFCKPKIFAGAKVSTNRVSLCRLLARLQDSSITTQEVESIVGADLALSYQLLRYINSAQLALPRQIESISHAVRLIGVEHIRFLASLMMLASLDDKPTELITTSLVRGRTCELMADRARLAGPNSFFTVGLLSTLDAFLDCSMEEALRLLPVSDAIRGALLQQSGPMGHVLRCVLAHERADWEALERLRADTGALANAYYQALEFSELVYRLKVG
jgi:EAL and modified HD-GYP domain-containing signal transduction protein